MRSLAQAAVPAQVGLRRQEAAANMRVANGPKGKLRMQRVIQFLASS